MAKPERAACERVRDRAVAGAVVGHHPLDPDPGVAEVGDRAAEEADRGRCLLVLEHLNVGQAGSVVDGDVHVLPADPAASAAAVAVDAVPGPADPTQLLHVDMEELARPLPLIAVGRLRRLQAGEPAEPDPSQDRRDGRERHP